MGSTRSGVLNIKLRENIILNLNRTVGESIIIGDNITITVLSVTGNQVRFGVDAPKEVGIWREELYFKGIERDSNKHSRKE